jgi:hypothetical protein
MSNSISFDQVLLNNQLLTTTGNQLFLNGLLVGSGNFDGFGTAANSGSALLSDIVGLSGVLNSSFATALNLFQTGSNLQSQINTASANFSASGQTLYLDLTNWSGSIAPIVTSLVSNLTQTGVNLAATFNAVFNTLAISIASTGQQAWITANNNGINVSGNMTATGAALYLDIVGMSGIFVTAFGQTGATLNANIAALSGYVKANMGGNSGGAGPFLNVQQFGVVGNGSTNDTFTIQTAISYYQNNSTGYAGLYFPPLSYAKTGMLKITGSNLNFLGFGGATIFANSDTDFQSILFSGCSNVIWDGINIFGGRTSNTSTPGDGIIDAISTTNLTIKNSNIYGSIGHCIVPYGANYGMVIDSNRFSNFQVGVYAKSSFVYGVPGTGIPQKFRITNNKFNDSWGNNMGYAGAGGQNYFGAIKFQPYLNQSGYSAGNNISDNTIVNTNQMGIELWGNVTDSIVSRNYIEGTAFGISIANFSKDITVYGNVLNSVSNWAIELADSFNVTVVSNVINGLTGSSSPGSITLNGITCNGVSTYPAPNYYNLTSNIIKDCYGNSIYNYLAKNINIVGNTLINSNSGYVGGSTLFYNQASSFVNFSNNSLTHALTGGYFIFLDASINTNTSGITISNNDINGSVGQWGILYYSSATGGNCNVLIENNRTHNVKYTYYTNTVNGVTSMVGFNSAGPNTNSAISYTHRNNLGNPSGAGYFIPDATIPTSTNNTNYITQSIGSFTPLTTGWYRVISGGSEHVGGNLRFYTIGGGDQGYYIDDEVLIDVNGYGSFPQTINWIRHSNYAGGNGVGGLRVGNNGGSVCMVDIAITNTGLIPVNVAFYDPIGNIGVLGSISSVSVAPSNQAISTPTAGVGTNQNMTIGGSLTLAGTNVGSALGYTTSFVPLSLGWWRIISGNYNHIAGTVRIAGQEGNSLVDEEISFDQNGYGIGGSINWLRHCVYNGPVISQARIGTDGGAYTYFDVLIAQTGNGVLSVNAFGPDMAGVLTNITNGASTPASSITCLPSNLGFATSQNLFASGNATIGGALQLYGSLNFYRKADVYSNANAGAASSLPGTPAGYMALYISGSVSQFKIPFYNA